MPESILDSTSFSCLGDTPQDALRKLFDHETGQVILDSNQLFKDRKLIATSFESYSTMLDKTDPVTFKYQTPAQRAALERDLLFAFYVMSAQYKLAASFALDAAESRKKDLKEYNRRIKKCAELLVRLRSPVTPDAAHAAEQADEDRGYLAYMGMSIIPELIANGIEAIASGDPEAVGKWKNEGFTVLAKDSREAINKPRLYWVWANGWIQTWISLLSDYFTRKQQALDSLSKLLPITGFLSFGLYLTNAAIELSMVLKHSIRSRWWMSEEEYNLQINGHNATFGERLKAQADLRKYSILNDFVWGLGNMACFFWLTGTGTFGYYGNVVTTALLLMDVIISGFIYLEEKKQHKADLTRYNRDIGDLKAKIEQQADANEKAILSAQLKTLEKAKARCEFEWKHKTYRLVKDWTYSIALILSFVTMCCLLLPPTVAVAPAVGLLLSVGGTALCFTFSLISDAAEGYLGIKKTKELAKIAKNEIEDIENGLLEKFKTEQDPDVKKLLYLEMMQLRAEFDYQKETARYQQKLLVYTVFIRLFVPPLVVASLILLPLGIGLPVLAAGFALAHQSYRLAGAKPAKGERPDTWDGEKFQKFETKADRKFDDIPRFFSKKASEPAPSRLDDEPAADVSGLPAHP